MRDLVYTKRASGLDLTIDYKGRKFNHIVLEIFIDSMYSFPDVLKRGSMVIETDGFVGDAWKLYALNIQRDYMLNGKNYDLIYHQLMGGYGGIQFGSGYGRTFMLPLEMQVFESQNFSFRVTNCHTGTYSNPRNLPLSYSVSLYYDDSISFPKLEYVSDIRQGESKNWFFDKKTNAYLLSSFLPDSGDYAPQFNSNMSFSTDLGAIPLSSIITNTQRINCLQYYDQNFLLGYPIRNIKELSVYNAFLSSDAGFSHGEEGKRFDLWIEK